MDLRREPAVSQWLAVAALLHAGAVGALWASGSLEPRRTSAWRPEVIEIEVTTVDDAPRAAAVTEAPTPGLPARAATASAGGSSIARTAAGPGPVIGGPVETAGVITAPEGASTEPWTFRAEKGPDLLARGQLASLVTRREAAAAEREGSSTTGGVAEALLEADVAKGLGRGGPVVSALEDVARTNDAPVRGVATFDIVLYRGGGADVVLDSADTDFASWSRLTRAMSEAVAKKSVRIPDAARGLRMTVRLDARLQFPDGREVNTLGPFARTTGLVLQKDSMAALSAAEATLPIDPLSSCIESSRWKLLERKGPPRSLWTTTVPVGLRRASA